MTTTNLTTLLSNAIIVSLINQEPEYPWQRYISNSENQFEERLPKLIQHPDKEICLYINTDDETLEFTLRSSVPHPEESFKETIGQYTFWVYLD